MNDSARLVNSPMGALRPSRVHDGVGAGADAGRLRCKRRGRAADTAPTVHAAKRLRFVANRRLRWILFQTRRARERLI